MANLRTMGILLDTLNGGDESPLTTRPVAPIARTAFAARVARDASQPGLPVARPDDRPVATDALVRRVPDARVDGRLDGRLDRQADAAPPLRPSAARGVSDAAPVIRGANSQPASASIELSATAQWLQRSLLAAPANEMAASIRAPMPLVPAAPGDIQVLAQALRESIAQSGLFYESHLADWAVQRYPEDELRREPQAGWSGAMTTSDKSPVTGEAADGGAIAVYPGAGDERGQGGGHPSVELLRAQLQALELRQFSWQGEVWPGQTGAMTITEDDATPISARPPAWRIQLTLTLPELGQVDVNLRIDGTTLQLALATTAAHSVGLLREARAALVAALEADSQATVSVAIRQS
jgi:hypothetical protein